ncbi:MAG: maleylpyruvate isomerase family mycothiol-dependent enzyme [Actinobacteria bacterium]|nr:maleylpyruvate isomerase family mycothiol-dependent enzyme [Actinomycetota bacterium]
MTGGSVFDALDQQHRELGDFLERLEPADWEAASRCDGWSVADVVLHLAQTDELVIAGCTGAATEARSFFSPNATGVETVDDAAERAVQSERGLPIEDLVARWRRASETSRQLLRDRPPSQRIPWVVGDLPPRTLATTRLAEYWIHTGDVFPAGQAADDRLWHIARLAWRTLPYAFSRAGVDLSGPVDLRITSPEGDEWAFEPDGEAATTVIGPALDWCRLAARRAEPVDTALKAKGPDADAVLRLARTFA